LLKIFDSLSSAEWIQQKFNTHVDQVSTKLVHRLMKFDFGVPSRSSERNKVNNIASKIKNRAKRILDPEVERAAKRQREDSKPYEPPQVELDDLLPLNRRGTFDEDLVEMVKTAKSTGEPLSLVMLDIDHFKGVNDRYGHPVGDEVLIAVAELAIKSLANKGKAYRYGGEEFALLLPNLSVEEAVGLAERIRKDIEKTTVSSKSLKVTVSFGIASVPDHAKNSKTLLERADAALYEAKNMGRNRVRFDGEPKPDKASSSAKKR
jgi:diguanylate cyclase (GGDEF)-like protein